MTSVVLRLSPDEPGEGAINILWTGHSTDPITGRFAELLAGTRPPEPAVDLLLLACAVYAADKAVRRDWTADRWTRDIDLDVPQTNPQRLSVSAIEELLRFMTGDRWHLTTHATDHAAARLGVPNQPELVAPSGVALFSGGVDSFAHLASAPPSAAMFVAHRDRSGLSPLQQTLFAAATPAGSDWHLRQFFLTVNRAGPLEFLGDLETSTRSRSLLFYAAAIALATGIGTPIVKVPENGFVSVNPPLVAARRGTLSTRTTHPWTIHLMNGIIDGLGLDVTLVNPFALLTKGEITKIALDHAPASRVFDTVSCARPRPRQKSTVHFGNCGYCFPCLVRRAGIVSQGVKDRTTYRNDPRRVVSFLTSPTGDDFRAVVTRAREPFTISDLTITGPFPPGVQPAAVLDLIERSREELHVMVDAGLTTAVRRQLNW